VAGRFDLPAGRPANEVEEGPYGRQAVTGPAGATPAAAPAEPQGPTQDPREVAVKVAMLVRIQGTRNGQPWPEDGRMELPDDEAWGYIRAGMAEPVDLRDKARWERERP
jgi:hypothetical protein